MRTNTPSADISVLTRNTNHSLTLCPMGYRGTGVQGYMGPIPYKRSVRFQETADYGAVLTRVLYLHSNPYWDITGTIN